MGTGSYSKDNDDDHETNHSEHQPFREGLRRNACTGQLRRSRFCACGRPRALIRHGHRWERLSACWQCLSRGSAIGLNLGTAEPDHA